MNDFRKIIYNYYPELIEKIEQQVNDKRRKKSCTYTISSLILATVMMYMLRKGSRNGMNEDGKNKQDYEYNATMRLMSKLKKAFGRLPICLVMDGLYLKHPVQYAIKQYGWEYHGMER